MEKIDYKNGDFVLAENLNKMQDTIIELSEESVEIKNDINNIANITENITLIKGTGTWYNGFFKIVNYTASRVSADISSLNLQDGDKIGLKDYSEYVYAIGENNTDTFMWINDGYQSGELSLSENNYIHAKVVLFKKKDNTDFTNSDYEKLYDLFYTSIEQKKVSFNKSEKHSNYIHLSFDDVEYCLTNLISNADNFASIFEEPFLGQLKKIHDNYGAVFSLYVYKCSYVLSNVTNKFANEFTQNSDWLKFGFHCDTLYDYTSATSEVASTDYNNFITQIITLAGGVNSIDRIVRLNMYAGNEDVCTALRDCNCGVYGFLTADAVRPSYYLSENQRNYLQNHSKLYDLTKGLVFYSTNIRLDWFNSDFSSDYVYTVPVKNNPYDELVYRYGLSTYCDAFQPLIVFTHEWDVYDSYYVLNSKIDRIEQVCKFAKDYNFMFDFPMNRTENFASLSIV